MPSSGTFSIGTNGRDYSTISGWEADTDNDLVTADEVQVGECYNDSAFDEAVDIAGATTDSTRYRVLTVAEGERHDGTAGAGARLIWSGDVGDARVDQIAVNDAYTRTAWLEVSYSGTPGSGSGDHWGVRDRFPANDTHDRYLHHLIVHGIDGSTTDNRGIQANANNGTEHVHNCIVYHINNGQASVGRGITIVGRAGESPGELLNCTVDVNDAAIVGVRMAGDSDNLTVRNVVAVRAGGGDFANANPDMAYCASSDGTADFGDTNNIVNLTASNEFIALGSDYHLQASSQLIDAGTDLGDVPAKIDIDGGDRHAAGVVWDIGADEEGLPVPTTFDTSVTEGFSLSEVYSVSLTMDGAISEGMTLSEVLDVAKEMSGQVAEKLTLDEVLVGEVAIGLEVAEGLSLSDDVEVAFEFAAGLAEALGVGDQLTAQLVAAASLTEALTLDELLQFTHTVDVAEGMTLGDLLELAVDFQAGASETTGFDDTYEVTVAALGALRVTTRSAPLTEDHLLRTPASDERSYSAGVREDIERNVHLTGETP